MPIVEAVQGRKGSGVAIDYRGVEVLAGWKYIPYLSWGIVVKIDTEEAFAPIRRLTLLSSGIGLLTLITLVMVALSVSKSISDPITKMTRITGSVAQGDLSQRVDVTANNEIGQLAGSFNMMSERLGETLARLHEATESLKVSNEQLEDYSRTLELKVEERTGELKLKNSELEHALVQLKETQQQLVMQEKLASLGSLTAGIAHEIKNPLNFVINFAGMSVDLVGELREGFDKQRDRLDASIVVEVEDLLQSLALNVEKINEHGKRADSIVRGMLLHSRGKPGERQLTNINSLLEEYVNLAYHGMRAQDSSFNITIQRDYDQSLEPVEAVPQDLSRVFLNVLNNACYASHAQKKERGPSFQPSVTVRTRNDGHWVEIRIRDNGQGIPPALREKIFNPFFTTKPTGMGTGLGLSISYEIVVQQHRGEMWVESEEGSYAEFILRLPKRAEGPDAGAT